MKHRLVGAAVLVALGIIAWPVLFDTSQVREISQRSQIPPAPPVEPFTVEEPARPEPPVPDTAPATGPESGPPGPVEDSDAAPPEPAGPAATVPAPQAAAPKAAPPKPRPAPVAQLDKSGLPEQWAVQLGVFGSRQNADEVRQRAEKAGYHTLMQNADGKYRVLVGPKLDRAAADAQRREIAKKIGIDGFVTRYY